MALIQGSDITTESIIDGFQRAVVDNILSGAYHAGNPPMCRGFQCVPVSEMDHINNVNKVPNVGAEGDIVNADTVLKGLIDITKELTRVGTFTFILYMTVETGGTDYYGVETPVVRSRTEIDSMSGKVIFSKARIVQSFGTPSDKHGVQYGNIIKASNLNELFAAIYSQWSTCGLPHYDGEAEICHSSCHSNCHSNCHCNCHNDCHGWTIIRND